MYEPMMLALVDAATNARSRDAVAVVTLRNGREFRGRLEKPPAGTRTAHLQTDGGGWATVLIGEVAAVSVERADL